MGKRDTHLTRLLDLAAAARDEEAAGETPFGFDTRIVARWREMKPNDNGDLTRFVRRVALAAIVITILGGIGTYRQLNEDDETGEPLTNDYALVDSVIQRQFMQ
jgi:hypothetical protein